MPLPKCNHRTRLAHDLIQRATNWKFSSVVRSPYSALRQINVTLNIPPSANSKTSPYGIARHWDFRITLCSASPCCAQQVKNDCGRTAY